MVHSNTVICAWHEEQNNSNFRNAGIYTPITLFSKQPKKLNETVGPLLTLFNNKCEYDLRRTLGTQAKAAVHKCLQVPLLVNKTENCTQHGPTDLGWSSNTSSVLSYPIESQTDFPKDHSNYVNVYYQRKDDGNFYGTEYFGRNVTQSVSNFVGFCREPCVMPVQKAKKKCSKCVSSSKKSVSIKESKSSSAPTRPKRRPTPVAQAPPKCCKQPETDTIPHIKIGPRNACPIYGTSPCQGPNCKSALEKQDAQSPVKITEAFNSRRGVFEIVIRKTTGTKVRNELMLEWSPPSKPRC